MIVHLIDGTYEIFRQFYGLRRFTKKGEDPPLGAVRNVLRSVVKMLESDATHMGVATDHVIESFRNDLYAGYKTGEGIEPALLAQFHPLEDALEAMGVAVWRMTDLEADDGLAIAANDAARDRRVEKVCIWTVDKDLGQCVRGDRVVQMHRTADDILDESKIRARFGVDPIRIPDYLALVGDVADGIPGVPGIGARTAARLIETHGSIRDFPPDVRGEHHRDALLYLELTTLRTEPPLFDDVDELRWRGPTPEFAGWAEKVKDPKLVTRCEALLAR